MTKRQRNKNNFSFLRDRETRERERDRKKERKTKRQRKTKTKRDREKKHRKTKRQKKERQRNRDRQRERERKTKKQKNMFFLSFRSATQLTPASKVTLNLKGQPDSFCGYSIVDKSVDLIHNPNKVTQPKLNELKEKLAESRIFSTTGLNFIKKERKKERKREREKERKKDGLTIITDSKILVLKPKISKYLINSWPTERTLKL